MWQWWIFTVNEWDELGAIGAGKERKKFCHFYTVVPDVNLLFEVSACETWTHQKARSVEILINPADSVRRNGDVIQWEQ